MSVDRERHGPSARNATALSLDRLPESRMGWRNADAFKATSRHLLTMRSADSADGASLTTNQAADFRNRAKPSRYFGRTVALLGVGRRPEWWTGRSESSARPCQSTQSLARRPQDHGAQSGRWVSNSERAMKPYTPEEILSVWLCGYSGREPLRASINHQYRE